MATLMLENWADIRFMQPMLGHARLDTMQIDTQVSIRQLKQIPFGHPSGSLPEAKNGLSGRRHS